MFRPKRSAVEVPAGWWNAPATLIALTLVSILPLLWPTLPPLTDILGHMGRYRVELSAPDSLLRTRYYDFHWSFIANLGVDLLIVPVAALVGLEAGVKLVVIAIVLLTVTGMIGIAREVHGRVPPTALFALPFAYSFPFQWGFVNFLLAMALALNAYAIWLRLGRQGRFRLRAGLFVPIGVAIFVAHIFGWAVLCLLAFGAEATRCRDEGRGVFASIWRGGLACLPLAPPLILLAVWRSGDANGANLGFFRWNTKYYYMISALRNEVRWFDVGCMWALALLVGAGLLGLGLTMRRVLGIAALLLFAAYILLPRTLLGSAYADMRLAPYVMVISVLGLTLSTASARVAGTVAFAAILLFGIRIGLLTRNYAAKDAVLRHQLEALDHVPPNARIFAMVDSPCLANWDVPRMDHLGAMAIVRRDAFVNGQWEANGAQLLRIRYAPARGWAEDPTQVVRPPRCRRLHAKLYPQDLARVPRGAFDYVWLIDFPRSRWVDTPGLTPVWDGGDRGRLLRVAPIAPASDATPTPSAAGARTPPAA